MKTTSWIRPFLTFLCLCIAANCKSQAPKPGTVDDDAIIVIWRSGSDPLEFIATWNQNDSEKIKISIDGLKQRSFLISTIRLSGKPDSKKEFLDYFKAKAPVVEAEWNSHIEYRATPNDSFYSRQWHLPFTKANKAWDLCTDGLSASGDTIVIGIIDAGFDITHPELVPSVYTNRFEIPGDGIDNDNNGYVDDLQGWDFINDDNTIPSESHGTAVSGIIGAKGDNQQGISGINRNIKIIFCSVSTVSELINAYLYLNDFRERYNSSKGKQGAFVVSINASLGISNAFCDQHPVWAAIFNHLGENGIISVAATSNNSKDIEMHGDMPSTCLSPFLITVMSNDSFNRKMPSSAYGRYSVDISAPGQSLFTTAPNGNYQYLSGTSAAAPNVCGAIALMYSIPCLKLSKMALDNPMNCALMVKDAMIAGVQKSNEYKHYCSSGGTLDIEGSMTMLIDECNDSAIKDFEIISLFPNPCRDGFQLTLYNDTMLNLEIKLIDMNGKILNSFTYRNGGGDNRQRVYVDTEKLSPGLYILSVESGGEIRRLKFSKQ